MVEEGAEQPREGDDEVPPQIARQITHDYLDKHYRETLEAPVPELGGKSPRQAVRSEGARAVAGAVPVSLPNFIDVFQEYLNFTRDRHFQKSESQKINWRQPRESFENRSASFQALALPRHQQSRANGNGLNLCMC